VWGAYRYRFMTSSEYSAPIFLSPIQNRIEFQLAHSGYGKLALISVAACYQKRAYVMVSSTVCRD